MPIESAPKSKRPIIGVGGGIVIFVLLICSGLLALWWPKLRGAKWAARITQSRNNLGQIGLALHNYHDPYDTFPAGGTTSRDGSPHHSWQTVILPYVDSPPWYSDINFDDPWDDPVNRAVFERTIPVYMNSVISDSGSVDGFGISHYSANRRLLGVNTYVSRKGITDGASNTLMAGEVGGGFKAWGDPTNMRDPANGFGDDADKFGINWRSGGLFLMADGSVRFINSNVDPEVLRALATPAGGESIDRDSF